MKNLHRKNSFIAVIMAAVIYGFSSGEIRGRITDEMGQPSIGALVKVMVANQEVTGTVCDAEGNYSIKPIEAGKYDLLITFPQYKPERVEGVWVRNEEATYIDAELKPYGLDSAVVVRGYVKPVIDVGVVDIHTIGAEEMARMAVDRGDIKSALVNKSSDVYQDPNDGMLYVRGARKEATQYIIDGEKLIGSMEVPATAIQSASIITGGIPAAYGDLTGGVVIITTKDYFSGMREKNMWQRDRAERKEERELAEKKWNAARLREKEIEEEKQRERSGKKQ
jgi:Carboxypeptidase regulatory-like domain